MHTACKAQGKLFNTKASHTALILGIFSVACSLSLSLSTRDVISAGTKETQFNPPPYRKSFADTYFALLPNFLHITSGMNTNIQPFNRPQ